MQSSGRAAPRDCIRGKGIATPDQPREPKQSWRPQAPTGLDVRDHDRAPSLLNPDSEQAGSRSCVGRDRTDGRCDLDQVAAARLGRSGHLIAAAISAAPFRPLRLCRHRHNRSGRSSTATSSDVTRRPPSRRSRSTTWRVLAGTRLTLAAAWDDFHESLDGRDGVHARVVEIVRTGSEVGVDEGGCSRTRAGARCACRLSRIRPAASTPATPQSRLRRAAGVADCDAGRSRAWRCAPLARRRARSSQPGNVLVGDGKQGSGTRAIRRLIGARVKVRFVVTHRGPCRLRGYASAEQADQALDDQQCPHGRESSDGERVGMSAHPQFCSLDRARRPAGSGQE